MGFLVDILILFGAFLLNPGKRKKRRDGDAFTLDDLWEFYNDAVGVCKRCPCDLVPGGHAQPPSISLNIREAASFLSTLLDKTSLLINSEHYFLIPVDDKKTPLNISGLQTKNKLALLDGVKEMFAEKKQIGLYLSKSNSGDFHGNNITHIKNCWD